MPRFRAVLFILCILIPVGLVLVWWRAPSRSNQEAGSVQNLPSNESCRHCHERAWDEWSNSRHAQTWRSPEVQAAFQHFGHDRKCRSCHAPVPVFQTGLGQEVAFRSEDRDSGVNCLSCHARADGSVAATRDVPNAPCRPIQTPELTSSRACGVCHDAIHKDWQATEWPSRGKNCQSCHMRDSTDPARTTHACIGGYNIELVRSAVSMRVARRGDELEVELKNHGAGHNLPGERHNRLLIVDVLVTTADGQIALASQDVVKGVTPFRGESSAERLQYGQTYHSRFPLEPSAARARVRLLYKRFPWFADRQAEVLHEFVWENSQGASE